MTLFSTSVRTGDAQSIIVQRCQHSQFRNPRLPDKVILTIIDPIQAQSCAATFAGGSNSFCAHFNYEQFKELYLQMGKILDGWRSDIQMGTAVKTLTLQGEPVGMETISAHSVALPEVEV